MSAVSTVSTFVPDRAPVELQLPPAFDSLDAERQHHKAAIHQNHGLFTVGESVDEATWWFITIERSCQAQLLAEAAGTPQLIPDDAARFTRDQTGFPLAGWLSFQPLWDEITRTDPQLFQ